MSTSPHSLRTDQCPPFRHQPSPMHEGWRTVGRLPGDTARHTQKRQRTTGVTPTPHRQHSPTGQGRPKETPVKTNHDSWRDAHNSKRLEGSHDRQIQICCGLALHQQHCRGTIRHLAGVSGSGATIPGERHTRANFTSTPTQLTTTAHKRKSAHMMGGGNSPTS